MTRRETKRNNHEIETETHKSLVIRANVPREMMIGKKMEILCKDPNFPRDKKRLMCVLPDSSPEQIAWPHTTGFLYY